MIALLGIVLVFTCVGGGLVSGVKAYEAGGWFFMTFVSYTLLYALIACLTLIILPIIF